MSFAAKWIQLEIIILSEISQKEKDKYHMISLNMWNLNYDTNEHIYKTETDSDVEYRIVVAKGEEGRGGMYWEFGVSRCKLLHIEWINNKILLYSTENYIQCRMIKHNGKEYIKKDYICITESLFCIAVINTTL